MPTTLEPGDIALRLALAVLAGFLIGLNRGERGKPAGLRTTLLVCLAAALAMILANAMLATRGKSSDSFVQLDMMRLPLGILTGIGFIGAGTILKKGDLVIGVTTAATVWYATMLGLCFGAGKLNLGLAGLGLGLFVLWVLGHVESLLRQERQGTLVVICGTSGAPPITEEHIRSLIRDAGCQVVACGVRYAGGGVEQLVRCEVRWHARRLETKPPAFLRQLATSPGVRSVTWQG